MAGEWLKTLFQGDGVNQRGLYEQATGRDMLGAFKSPEFREGQRSERQDRKENPLAQRDGWLNRLFSRSVNPQKALEREALSDYSDAKASGGASLRMDADEIADLAGAASQQAAAQQASLAAELGRQQLASGGGQAGQFEQATQDLSAQQEQAYNQAYGQVQKSEAELAFDHWLSLKQGAWGAAASIDERRQRQSKAIVKGIGAAVEIGGKAVAGYLTGGPVGAGMGALKGVGDAAGRLGGGSE